MPCLGVARLSVWLSALIEDCRCEAVGDSYDPFLEAHWSCQKFYKSKTSTHAGRFAYPRVDGSIKFLTAFRPRLPAGTRWQIRAVMRGDAMANASAIQYLEFRTAEPSCFASNLTAL